MGTPSSKTLPPKRVLVASFRSALGLERRRRAQLLLRMTQPAADTFTDGSHFYIEIEQACCMNRPAVRRTLALAEGLHIVGPAVRRTLEVQSRAPSVFVLSSPDAGPWSWLRRQPACQPKITVSAASRERHFLLGLVRLPSSSFQRLRIFPLTQSYRFGGVALLQSYMSCVRVEDTK